MKRNILSILFTTALLLASTLAGSAQVSSKLLRQGKKALKNEHYAEAEGLYRKILSIDSMQNVAHYGLGNALYKQKKYAEATEAYAKIDFKKGDLDQKQIADVLHNVGNSHMKQKEYKQAIECYKQSLRLRPYDDSTRYNLALAIKLNKDDKQQNKQNQENQNDKQQPQQKQQNNNNESPKSQNEDSKQQPQQIDPKTAKQILDSYKQDDDNTRQKYELRQRNKEQKDANDRNKKRW